MAAAPLWGVAYLGGESDVCLLELPNVKPLISVCCYIEYSVNSNNRTTMGSATNSS